MFYVITYVSYEYLENSNDKIIYFPFNTLQSHVRIIRLTAGIVESQQGFT